jgi:hypothetical protein
VQLREEDFDGPQLLPWLDVHPGGVAALAANTGVAEPLFWLGCDASCHAAALWMQLRFLAASLAAAL